MQFVNFLKKSNTIGTLQKVVCNKSGQNLLPTCKNVNLASDLWDFAHLLNVKFWRLFAKNLQNAKYFGFSAKKLAILFDYFCFFWYSIMANEKDTL